jgi:FkbM family methyltransferase
MRRPHGLIFDIGLHNGDDTNFYLRKGFDVVAVDANPDLICSSRERFKNEILENRLTLIHGAITDFNAGAVPFYINAGHTDWSSVFKEVAARQISDQIKTISVPALRLSDIIGSYGTPFYLKIDIEGGDRAALLQLATTAHRPKYISVEAHDVAYLAKLREMGYDRFKIINQATYWVYRLPSPPLVGDYVEHSFSIHQSGPFGEETPGQWVGYQDVDALFLDLQRLGASYPHLFHDYWYDFHATL